MPRQVHITSPLPSLEEIASRAGVPASRARELVTLAEEIAAPDDSKDGRSLRNPAPKQASSKRVIVGKSSKRTTGKKPAR